MKFFRENIKQEKPAEKTLLSKIRGLKNAGVIAATISLASTAEDTLAEKGKEGRETGSNQTPIADVRKEPGWKKLTEDHPRTFDIIQDAPKPPAWVRFDPLDKEKSERGGLGNPGRISWEPDENSDHSVRNFTGSHSSACPKSVLKGSGADEKFSYGKQGAGYASGAREAKRNHFRAIKMGLSDVDYLVWLACQKSHDKATIAKGKALEAKGQKTMEEQKVRKDASEESESLLAEK